MSEIESLQRSLRTIRESLSPRLALSNARRVNHVQEAFNKVSEKFKDAGTPPKDLALRAARQFIAQPEGMDPNEVDLISFAIATPITSDLTDSLFNNRSKLKQLLQIYSDRCEKGIDMLITWRGVMAAYFDLNPDRSPERELFNNGRESLRNFLNDTWPKVKASTDLRLSWMQVLDEHPEILSSDPCDKFTRKWLEGDSSEVTKLSGSLQIPSVSWFWEQLFISCVQHVVNQDDASFKRFIPELLHFFDCHKIYRDKGLSALFDRYAGCADRSVNKVLKEYALDLWGSPEGHVLAGSKWKNVSSRALTMVLNWVHESNLRLFIELLKERGYADEERLNFWLKYIPQVTASRLVLGERSQRIVEGRTDLKKIFSRSGSSYSKLIGDTNPDNDAFLMAIGPCLIVDFSIQGGCYIYRSGTNNFKIDDKNHFARTSRGGLKEKYRTLGMDFAHTPGWTDSHRAPRILRSDYGITPNDTRFGSMTSNGLQNIDVTRYFGGDSTQPESLKPESSVETSAPPQQSLSKHEKIAMAKLIAGKFGAQWSYKSDTFIVYTTVETGPVAEELRNLGMRYSKGVGWMIE